MNFPTLKIILFRIYRFYVKKHFNKILISLLLSFGVAGSTAAIAWLLDPAIKKMFIEQDRSMMLLIPVAIVLAFSLKGVSLYFARIILIKVGNGVVKEIQIELASSVLKSDIHTLESKHSGKYLSHFLYDVNQVNQLVSAGVLNLMKDTLTLSVLVSLMFYQNWKLALFALIVMPFAAFIAKSLGKRMGKATTESAQVSASLTSFLSEMIKGSRMIKIYQQENFELNRSSKLITSMMNKRNKLGFILIRATPIMEVLTGFMIAGFIYYSGFMIASGEMGINNFFSFLTAMMLAYQPIRSLATINMLFYQGAAGAERVFNVLDAQPNIKEIESCPDLKINLGKIEFKNVSFSYPNTDEAAIQNINLNIEGGSTAALVGHSGAGKSTIINLLPRFYDPNEGEVYIDKQKINNVSLSSLRKNISMVSQDIILFDDTIRANIAYANQTATDEQINKACDFAAASDFIKNMPKGYETLIGENGIRLSGGQKQRISIARAVLKNSPVILLDEATSSLDAESEEKVQNAIINLTKNKTTLVIAHRLSTIIRADKIFVLNEGKIADTGTHNELLKNSMIYKNLYSKQLSS
ncbi:ABC transporter ATP-binding protein/permease [Pelagibacteraceae bacterium]|nr:ABC transporter ATP-binding protein/permease [Pelagibacteraceae bacterium]|tara:strand:- start:133 stop:1878 length:1746 start_codon:yes stop_codon:yes gene_type:complete